MSDPLVSVVIPAFRRTTLLEQALRSVLEQDYPAGDYEIIVVDSSPDDANTRLVDALRRRSGPDLHVYRKRPEGPGPSRSLGVQESRGQYIAFLDSDCQATPGWIRNGIAAFTERVGIVQGRTVPNPGQPLHTFVRYVTVEAENQLYDAANIFFRRSCYLDGGVASVDMTPGSERPTGGEDTLLAWRAKRRGWHSVFARDALVYHEVHRVSPWQWLFDKRYLMLPWLAREVPEIRTLFYHRVFLDRGHAMLLLALLGLGLLAVHPALALLAVPYMLHRLLGPSRSLGGAGRLLRLFVYLPRDVLALSLLALGSLRYRALLL